MLQIDRSSLITVVAAIVCIAAIGISATALDASLTTGLGDVSSQQSTGSGVSLLALLLLLIQAILSLFGIELRGSLSTGSASSLLGLLLLVLEKIVEYLPIFFTLFTVVVALAVAVRYSDSMKQLYQRQRDMEPEWKTTTGNEQKGGRSLTNIDSSNEVYRAWVEMVQKLSSESHHSQTPHEWATIAIDAGLDPDAVDALTRNFTEIRYGNATITQERKRRARQAYQQLDGVSKEDSS